MNLTSQRAYSLITGILLFALGLLGFAFRMNFNVPDPYLVGCLILGFWGIVVGAQKSA